MMTPARSPDRTVVEEARAGAAAGRLDEALEGLRAVVAEEPLNVDALTLFVQVASRLGRIGEVRELADRLATLQDNQPGLFHLAGRLLKVSGRDDLALPYSTPRSAGSRKRWLQQHGCPRPLGLAV